jgi:hypothetical protein
MLFQLEAARPRWLAIPIASLFYEPFHGSDFAMDFTLPLFASLTHLDLFETLDDLSFWSGLALLPVLTHLAFLELHQSNLVNELFSTCRKLEVLISMYSEKVLFEQRILAGDDMDEIEERFVLMVVTSEDYVVEWQIGTQGGMDFWARADAFVAKKRRGEIEPSLCS